MWPDVVWLRYICTVSIPTESVLSQLNVLLLPLSVFLTLPTVLQVQLAVTGSKNQLAKSNTILHNSRPRLSSGTSLASLQRFSPFWRTPKQKPAISGGSCSFACSEGLLTQQNRPTGESGEGSQPTSELGLSYAKRVKS